jgi:hypothetical protein
MFHKKRTFLTVIPVLLVCALFLVSCGTESNDEGTVSKQEKTISPAASASGTKAVDPIVPSGWKTVTSDNWTFSIPDDWVEGSMRTYHPKGAVNSMGVAHTFCLTGVNEIEETGIGDDLLKYLVGFGPLNKIPKTVCGKDGYMVEGKEGLALLYEFEPRPGYGPEFAVDAIWCTASSSSTFRQYEAIFRHIIDSVECSAD